MLRWGQQHGHHPESSSDGGPLYNNCEEQPHTQVTGHTAFGDEHTKAPPSTQPESQTPLRQPPWHKQHALLAGPTHTAGMNPLAHPAQHATHLPCTTQSKAHTAQQHGGCCSLL